MKAWLKRNGLWLGLFAVAAVLVGTALFATGLSCARSCGDQPPVVVEGIDAAPGERAIDAELDAAVREGEARLAAIRERYRREEEAARVEHETRLASLRAERDRVLDAGGAAVAEWLNEWLAAQRDGGVPASGACMEADRWCARYGERSATCADARARCRAGTRPR